MTNAGLHLCSTRRNERGDQRTFRGRPDHLSVYHPEIFCYPFLPPPLHGNQLPFLSCMLGLFFKGKVIPGQRYGLRFFPAHSWCAAGVFDSIPIGR